MRSRSDLHDYQIEAIEELENREEAFVWLGLGDGKTVIALTAIADLNMTALVVGTKNIVELTWPGEIKNWTHLSGITYASATGSKRLREKAIESQPTVLGVNYENLKWLYQNSYHLPYEILIMDEVSKMKAHNTQRFRAHRKFVPAFKRRYGLTATPASESYLGLWSQSKSILTGSPLGRTVTEFRNAYTTPQFKGTFTEYTIEDENKRAIEEALEPYVITVDSDIKRPEPTIIDRTIPWSTTGARRQYEQMERDLIVELESTTIGAASRGVAFNKCRQLASGFVYDSEKEAHAIDEAKIDAIVETIEEAGSDPVLVFYQFKWERDELRSRIPGSEGLDQSDAAERFNRGDIPALIVHPASAGHGLNLQGACRHVMWASLPWSLEQYLQANGRVDRQGQERQVVITRFFRENTIEWDVAEKLDQKWTTQEELVNRVKSRNLTR